jgi:SAM-dependent methyltransferase
MSETSNWPGDFQRNPQIYHHAYLHLRELSEQIKKTIKAEIGNKKVRILDVGCHNKPYYPFFEGVAKSYIGLDVYPGEKVDIISKAEKIPFKENTFDVVVCFQVLEHIEDPQKAINEMHRVLKKGGILMLSTHGNMHNHGIPNDYWRWTRYGLQKILKKFKDVHVMDNCDPGMTLFQINNFYVQRLNLFHLMTPVLVFNNIVGRVADKILPHSVTIDLFLINYFVLARK